MNSHASVKRFLIVLAYLVMLVMVFIIFVEPTKEKVMVLNNPTISIEVGDMNSNFRITSDNSVISLTAVSFDDFVLEVDGKNYFSSKGEDIVIEGKIKEVRLRMSEEIVNIKLISDQDIEISRSRIQEVLSVGFWMLFFFFISLPGLVYISDHYQ